MDANTGIILVVALFAVIIVAAFLVFRGRSKIRVESLLGTLEMDASNPQPVNRPGASFREGTVKGNATVIDKGGEGAEAVGVKVGEDLQVINEAPPPQTRPK